MSPRGSQLGVTHRRRETSEPGRRHEHAVLHESAHQPHEALGFGRRGPRAPIVAQLAVHRVKTEQRAQAGDASGNSGLLEAVVEARAELGAELGEPGIGVGCQEPHSGQAGGHRHRVGVERPAVRRRRRPAPRGIEHRHDVGPSRKGAHRKAAADDLAERGHVRRHAQCALGTVVTDTERDDLVEDQHDAVRARHVAEGLQELGPSGDEADAVGDRIHQHRRQVRGLALDARDGVLRVIERQHDDVLEHRRRRPLRVRGTGRRRQTPPVLRGRSEAHLGVVVRAVVRALELRDLRAAREGSRALERDHHRLAARVGEAHALGRGQPLAQERRQLDLLGRRHRERRTQREPAGRGFHDRRVGVAMDQRRVVVQAVQATVTLDVGDPAAFSGRGVWRVGCHVDGRARVAARQHALGAREERGRFRARLGPPSGPRESAGCPHLGDRRHRRASSSIWRSLPQVPR